MKRSPIFPRDGKGSCNEIELGFDPHKDFSKFLEEARKHASRFNTNQESSLPPPTSVGNTVTVEAPKNAKKSWKRFLSSLWKLNTKSSSAQQEVTSSDGFLVPERKPGSVSGPIFGGGGRRVGLSRKSMSGPLAECFIPTRVEENELPYKCLDCPSGVQAFGPIYLVT